MSAIGAALAGQRAAEQLMVDTCEIKRPTGYTTDPDTAQDVETYEPVYSGKCKIQTKITRVQEAQAGEHTFTTQRSEIHLPMTAGPVKLNDVVTITASAISPMSVGAVYRIMGMQPKTFQTAQRIPIEEVLG